jgi:3-hydroxybutyryl-CoA dehydrogenase
MMEVLTIIGPGTLGRSLAEWASIKGLEVRLAGRSLAHANLARNAVLQRWQRGAEKGRMTLQSLEEAQGRLKATATWEEALEGVDIVLEALPEDLEVKAGAWRRIHQMASRETLRLTGSSSLPVTRLAALAECPGELQGFHLFVPVDRMRVVEFVVPTQTSEELEKRGSDLAELLGLTMVRVQDQPGYAASRMALAQGLEAMRLLETGVASAEGLDTLMVKGYGHPIGPLALSDLIGLDLRLTIADGIFRSQGDSRFVPPQILRDLVAQGRVGKKVGQGFLTWQAPGGDP